MAPSRIWTSCFEAAKAYRTIADTITGPSTNTREIYQEMLQEPKTSSDASKYVSKAELLKLYSRAWSSQTPREGFLHRREVQRRPEPALEEPEEDGEELVDFEQRHAGVPRRDLPLGPRPQALQPLLVVVCRIEHAPPVRRELPEQRLAVALLEVRDNDQERVNPSLHRLLNRLELSTAPSAISSETCWLYLCGEVEFGSVRIYL